MKTGEDKQTNVASVSSANNTSKGNQIASQNPPPYSVSNGEASSKGVCDRRVDIHDGIDSHWEDMKELEKREILKESYTQQTITELITLRSDDNKGSNDPYTQFVHAFYSPADEFDKGINTLENLPTIMNSLDEALKTGAPDKIENAANVLWDASKEIPSTPITGIPKSRKDVFKLKKIISMLFRQYEAWVVEQLFEGGCKREDQIESQIGRIMDYSFLFDTLRFQPSNGSGVMTARYSDLPSEHWWQDEDSGYWYVEPSYLPNLEAKVKSRK
jgi:hypothetical protein